MANLLHLLLDSLPSRKSNPLTTPTTTSGASWSTATDRQARTAPTLNCSDGALTTSPVRSSSSLRSTSSTKVSLKEPGAHCLSSLDVCVCCFVWDFLVSGAASSRLLCWCFYIFPLSCLPCCIKEDISIYFLCLLHHSYFSFWWWRGYEFLPVFMSIYTN